MNIDNTKYFEACIRNKEFKKLSSSTTQGC